MGVWKKTLVYLGLVEEDEFEEQEVPSYEEPRHETSPTIRKIPREELSSVTPMPAPRPVGQVHIVEPRTYDDAKDVGDKMRDSVPVIMNLQGVEDDLYKRLTAFAAGLAYGLDGKVQRLAPRVYLVTPAGVEVSAEERRRLAERGFFDEL